MRISSPHQKWVYAAACALLATGLGCRSAPEPVDQERPERTTREAMPSPEELGDNPCGNPNWAKLPPDVGEVAQRTPAEEPAEESEDETEDDLE